MQGVPTKYAIPVGGDSTPMEQKRRTCMAYTQDWRVYMSPKLKKR